MGHLILEYELIKKQANLSYLSHLILEKHLKKIFFGPFIEREEGGRKETRKGERKEEEGGREEGKDGRKNGRKDGREGGRKQ